MSTNPIKQSPIAVLTSAEATAAGVLAFLVAHGVIPADVARTYGVYFVLLYVAVFGVAKWWHVMPWEKGKQLVSELEDGRLPDADIARVLAGVADLIHDANGTDYLATHATGDDHPDALAIGEPPADAGMSAGSPPVTA